MGDLRQAFLDGADAEQTAAVVPYTNPRTPDGKLFGRQFYLRRLTGEEQDVFQASKFRTTVEYDAAGMPTLKSAPNQTNISARFAVLVLSDKDGNRVFEDHDAEAVGRADWQLLSDIFAKGFKHNGMTAEADGDAKKNSGPEVKNGSGMSSPATSAA